MKKPGVIGCLAISGVLFAGVRGAESVAQGPFHLGAPPLIYHCPQGQKAVRHWEKGIPVSPAPGELTWHGWTEYASCPDSLTITGGNR